MCIFDPSKTPSIASLPVSTPQTAEDTSNQRRHTWISPQTTIGSPLSYSNAPIIQLRSILRYLFGGFRSPCRKSSNTIYPFPVRYIHSFDRIGQMSCSRRWWSLLRLCKLLDTVKLASRCLLSPSAHLILLDSTRRCDFTTKPQADLLIFSTPYSSSNIRWQTTQQEEYIVMAN